MTLRSVSFTAIGALLVTAALHIGHWAAGRTRQSAPARVASAYGVFGDDPSEAGTAADAWLGIDAPDAPGNPLPGAPLPFAPVAPPTGSAQWPQSAEAPVGSAEPTGAPAPFDPPDFPAVEPLGQSPEAVVDLDLHPPIRALHRTIAAAPPRPDASAPDVAASDPRSRATTTRPSSSRIDSMMPPPPPVTGPTQSAPTPVRAARVDPSRSAARPTGAPQRPSHVLAGDQRSAALRRLIEQELPDAGADERRIWEEEFNGVALEVVRELLRLRRRVNHAEEPADDGAEPETAALPHRLPPPRALRQVPDAGETISPRGGRDDLEPRAGHDAADALLHEFAAATLAAELVHLTNIANARTPGYRRRVVGFAGGPIAPKPVMPEGPTSHDTVRDSAASASDAAHGRSLDAFPAAPAGQPAVRLAAPRLDAATQGEMLETGEPLDIAIDGPGFLETQHAGGRRFTRCGRLTLDERRRLCVRAGADVLPVLPEVTLPENAGAVRVEPDGQVDAQVGDSTEWTPAGRLKLVRFLNPSELTPVGDVLLAASSGTGEPQPGKPGDEGYGRLRSRTLEQSNVDMARERTELIRLAIARRELAEIRGGGLVDETASRAWFGFGGGLGPSRP